MKKNLRLIAPILVIVAFILALLLINVRTAIAEATTTIVAQVSIQQPPAQLIPIVVTPKDILSKRQRAWLGALMWCESKARPEALNKVDRDGTPSYGILQFKPGTFHYFLKRYNLGTSTDYLDPELQQRIVEQMILKADVKWSQQFPDCTRKLGTPPQVAIN